MSRWVVGVGPRGREREIILDLLSRCGAQVEERSTRCGPAPHEMVGRTFLGYEPFIGREVTRPFSLWRTEGQGFGSSWIALVLLSLAWEGQIPLDWPIVSQQELASTPLFERDGNWYIGRPVARRTAVHDWGESPDGFRRDLEEVEYLFLSDVCQVPDEVLAAIQPWDERHDRRPQQPVPPRLRAIPGWETKPCWIRFVTLPAGTRYSQCRERISGWEYQVLAPSGQPLGWAMERYEPGFRRRCRELGLHLGDGTLQRPVETWLSYVRSQREWTVESQTLTLGEAGAPQPLGEDYIVWVSDEVVRFARRADWEDAVAQWTQQYEHYRAYRAAFLEGHVE